jgi:hypothetical protein
MLRRDPRAELAVCVKINLAQITESNAVVSGVFFRDIE